MILLPDPLQTDHGGRGQPGGFGAEQRSQGLAEVTGADPTQVEPGDQLLNALGLPKIRRQDVAGESDTMAVFISAFVVDAGLPDGDGTQAGLNVTVRGVAVADDQAVAMGITLMGMDGDVIRHIGLDRLAQHLPGAVSKDLGQHILRRSLWNTGVGSWYRSSLAYPPV